MKSVIFKLTSRLGNLTPNVSDPISDSSSSQLHVRSTENPKREITIDKDEHRNSLKNTNNVYIASTSHTRSKVQRPSVTSEKLNTESTTYKNYRTPHGKPIKTESTTFSSAERTATGRKIISKIHFGFPQSIVNPKKINNLATTTSNSFISSSIETDYDSSSQEVSNERTNVFDHYSTNSNERSTTVPYTTTNYPTTARSSYKFSINSGSPSTTERGNKVRYTPKTFENNNKYVPSTSTAASTSTSELSKPLYYYSSTTERHVPSTSTASTTSTTSIRTTTTTTTTSTTTTTASPSTTTTTTTTTTTLKPYTDIDSLVRTDNYRAASNNDDVHTDTDSERVRTQLFANRNAKPFRATAEVPSVSEILAVHDDEQNKKELDSPPTYKPKPFQLSTANDANQTNKTVAADQSRNFTIPARVSRVNTAIKSLIAFGGTRRNSQSSKCNENQTTPDTKCNEIQKQRYLFLHQCTLPKHVTVHGTIICDAMRYANIKQILFCVCTIIFYGSNFNCSVCSTTNALLVQQVSIIMTERTYISTYHLNTTTSHLNIIPCDDSQHTYKYALTDSSTDWMFVDLSNTLFS